MTAFFASRTAVAESYSAVVVRHLSHWQGSSHWRFRPAFSLASAARTSLFVRGHSDLAISPCISSRRRLSVLAWCVDNECVEIMWMPRILVSHVKFSPGVSDVTTHFAGGSPRCLIRAALPTAKDPCSQRSTDWQAGAHRGQFSTSIVTAHTTDCGASMRIVSSLSIGIPICNYLCQAFAKCAVARLPIEVSAKLVISGLRRLGEELNGLFSGEQPGQPRGNGSWRLGI